MLPIVIGIGTIVWLAFVTAWVFLQQKWSDSTLTIVGLLCSNVISVVHTTAKCFIGTDGLADVLTVVVFPAVTTLILWSNFQANRSRAQKRIEQSKRESAALNQALEVVRGRTAV